MKTILIPTDFTISSLNAIKSAVSIFDKDTLCIKLLHVVKEPVGISEMLFHSRRINGKFITEDFKTACDVIKNKYSSQIKSIIPVFFQGTSSLAFKNFLSGYKVEAIVIPEPYTFNKIRDISIDPMPLLKKSKMEVVPAYAVKTQATKTSANSLSELLPVLE